MAVYKKLNHITLSDCVNMIHRSFCAKGVRSERKKHLMNVEWYKISLLLQMACMTELKCTGTMITVNNEVTSG